MAPCRGFTFALWILELSPLGTMALQTHAPTKNRKVPERGNEFLEKGSD